MTSLKLFQDQDLSSPEEETASSFHTPKHSSIILGNSSRCVSAMASQDSIDVYHDAFSTPHSSQKFDFSKFPNSQTCCKQEHRRRHFSSEAKFVEEKDDLEDETAEDSLMLPSCIAPRLRHSNQGASLLSRSCNGSPYHIHRLSFSTNSLKRKSMSRASSSKCLNQPLISQGEQASNPVPSVEKEMVTEMDDGKRTKHTIVDGKNFTDVFTKETLINHDSFKKYSKCDQNNVSCAEIQSFYDLSFHLKSETDRGIELHKYNSLNFSRHKKRSFKLIKEEFNMTNFKFSHEAPHLFVTSQWQQPNKICCLYLAYRLFFGAYFLMWGIWSWVGFAGYNSSLSTKGFYPIFLTNWGIWLLTLDTALQARNVVLHMHKTAKEGDARYAEMKTSFKCSWILSNITSTLHIFITIFFWTLVYPHSKKPVSAISVNTHIIPCVYVLLDSFISATPRRLFHAYLPMILVTIYGIFTNIYYLAGGTNHKGSSSLYPLLDWSEQSKTLLIGSGIVLVIIPLLHVAVICVFSALRVKLWRTWNYARFNNRSEAVQTISMEEKV